MKGGLFIKKILEINIGDNFDDLICIGIINKNNKNYYRMKCTKCGREKDMLSSTIRYKHGTFHKACGKNLKTKNKIFYSRWQAMRTRTTNINYEHSDCYFKRGISSDEFKYFIDFYDELYDSFILLANKIGAKNVSLERIDYNKDYSKDNCIWINKNKQQANTRKNIIFEVTYPNGDIEIHKNLRGFAIDNNLSYSCVRDVAIGRLKEYKGYKFKSLNKV